MSVIDLGFEEIEAALPEPKRTLDNYDPNGVRTMLNEPAKTITPINPSDPARLGYPATFPLEIAMRVAPIRHICEAYGISREEWEYLRNEPLFLDELARAVEVVKQEGMSFKLKAQMQAAEALKTSWRLIHSDATPPNVRADLIKSTVRWAGYEQAAVPQSKDGGTTVAGNGFAIQINFQNNQTQTVKID